MILVTHHVEEIMPVFTHVLMLREGRVLASGERADVLTSVRLSEAFGAPCRLTRRGERYGLSVEAAPRSMM
jgi:iron complex transport system ATP-binding protein